MRERLVMDEQLNEHAQTYSGHTHTHTPRHNNTYMVVMVCAFVSLFFPLYHSHSLLLPITLFLSGMVTVTHLR